MNERIIPNGCKCDHPSGRTHVTSPIDQVATCSDCGGICKEDVELLLWLAAREKEGATPPQK